MSMIANETQNIFAVSDWDHYIGQDGAKRITQLRIRAAKTRGELIDHQLILGPPGVGKTTFGRLIAAEHGVNFKSVMATPNLSMESLGHKLVSFDEPWVDDDGDEQEGGGILLLDEIHLLKPGQQHFLYSVLEDGYVPYNNGAKYYFKNPVTIISCTTDPDKLSQALTDRFDHPIRLESYSVKEMAMIAERMCHRVNISGTVEQYVAFAHASAGSPRRIAALARLARDFGEIDVDLILEVAKITPEGVDVEGVKYLRALEELGGKAGIKNIANFAMSKEKVMEAREPLLMNLGLVSVTTSGRALTPQGLAYVKRLPSYM